jgi:DNA-binding SARP family transcriptional activator
MSLNREERRSLLKAAERLARRGRHAGALAKHRALLAASPDDQRSLLKAGDLHLRLGQHRAALQLYQRLAQILEADGLRAKAIAVYTKILSLQDAPQPTHLKLAELLEQAGLRGDALKHLRAAARLCDDASGRLEAVRRVVELEPDDVRNHLALARAYNERGLSSMAIETLQRAARSLSHEKPQETDKSMTQPIQPNVATRPTRPNRRIRPARPTEAPQTRAAPKATPRDGGPISIPPEIAPPLPPPAPSRPIPLPPPRRQVEGVPVPPSCAPVDEHWFELELPDDGASLRLGRRASLPAPRRRPKRGEPPALAPLPLDGDVMPPVLEAPAATAGNPEIPWVDFLGLVPVPALEEGSSGGLERELAQQEIPWHRVDPEPVRTVIPRLVCLDGRPVAPRDDGAAARYQVLARWERRR